MNKNRNLIIRNWKILALAACTAFVGCKRYEYKNVIKDIVTTDGENFRFLITDTKTGVERIYNYTGRDGISGKYHNQDLRYLHIGDTVAICYGCLYDPNWYQRVLVLYSDDMLLEYNDDSVRARKEREHYNQECAKLNAQKQEMLNTQSK